MIPFLESADGNCQNAVTLVEELAVTVKLPGDPEGTAMWEITVIRISLIV